MVLWTKPGLVGPKQYYTTELYLPATERYLGLRKRGVVSVFCLLAGTQGPAYSSDSGDLSHLPCTHAPGTSLLLSLHWSASRLPLPAPSGSDIPQA